MYMPRKYIVAYFCHCMIHSCSFSIHLVCAKFPFKFVQSTQHMLCCVWTFMYFRIGFFFVVIIFFFVFQLYEVLLGKTTNLSYKQIVQNMILMFLKLAQLLQSAAVILIHITVTGNIFLQNNNSRPKEAINTQY